MEARAFLNEEECETPRGEVQKRQTKRKLLKTTLSMQQRHKRAPQNWGNTVSGESTATVLQETTVQAGTEEN